MAQSAFWKLQDAKARFSEVVRRARSEGPQHVTVHGREEVVVVSAKEYANLAKPKQAAKTGKDIVDAFRDFRLVGFSVERESVRSPVRPTPTFDEPDDDR